MTAPKRRATETLLAPEAAQLVGRFCAAQRDRGCCEGYIATQRAHVEAFHQYLAWKPLALRAVTPETIQEFLAFITFLQEMLYARRLRPTTLRPWRFTIGEYCRWLVDEGVMARDPTSLPHHRKRWACKTRLVPAVELIERLLTLPDQHTYAGMRNQAIFGLTATVGLSNSELIHLTMDDLELPNRRLRVRPVAGPCALAERWAPLEPQVQRALERYLAYARPAWLKDPALPAVFLVKGGKSLARHSVCEIFKDYSEHLGVKGLNCRIMKNVAALYQLRCCGRTLDELMRLFGHRHIRHMRDYLAYLPERQRRAAAKRTRYHWLLRDLVFEEQALWDRFASLKERFTQGAPAPVSPRSEPALRRPA